MNEAPENSGKATILVVDDSPANLSLMNKLLADDYKVKVATSGEKALKIAAADPPPDLILLDVMMSGMDGYDALISRRVYKEGMPHEKAVNIMIEGRGTHFDPDMLDAFVEIQEEFRAIARRFADSDADISKKKDYLVKAGTA